MENCAMSPRARVKSEIPVEGKSPLSMQPAKPKRFAGNPFLPAHPVVDCTIEAYSLGDTSRAHVRTRMREIEPGIFSLIPFYLREVCGPHVPWQSPEPGSAIQTTSPIATFDEAHDILVWWATQTIALNRRP
jgi:hypothetical protein